MSGPLITLGDKTSHGGAVIEASPNSDSGGKGIARVGDKITCPIPGHGINIIVEGVASYLIGGRMVALHGHRCACGCTLIASQFMATHG